MTAAGETGAATAPTAPLTVAITTLDRPDALDRCLRSLAAGEVLPAEVVIVDQSPARTAEPVAAAAGGLPSVRYEADGGRGLGRGQNRAVGLAGNDHVAILDDDCVAAGRWVAVAERLLAAEDHELIGGRVLPLPDERPGVVPVSSRISETPREFAGRVPPWDLGSGNNFAVRRSWFERIGGCDERLGPGSPGRGGVDMDLFYRLLRAGARGRYDPELLVHHEQKPREGRRSRRGDYGFGMAAACVLWLREAEDGRAAAVLGRWLSLRLKLLAAALLRRRWSSARDELLVLGGTARGVVHGLRVARRPA
jgi:GT2 family glycosyltransferase